jgi:hypothetical protein
MELFGFEFKRKEKEVDLPSFVEDADNDDGAVVISAGGAYGTYVDLDGTVRSEAELVTRYREMALVPECDAAIDEIVNESIAIDEKNLITLDLDRLDVSPQLKQIIKSEFNNCLSLIDFNKYAYEIYRRWYIDGRLYYHVMIDEKNPQLGIQELRFIDPRKIRKVREVQKKKAKNNEPTEITISKVVNEYYIFNDKGFNFGNKAVGTNTTGLRIAKDSIVHVVSGITDNQGQMVLSYLHKSIKPLNQLSTLEDALVIYRLARAPERRIWYIDVGNLPKMKAEQYVRDIMVKHKNRLIYDANTGQIRDDRKFMTMLEDYWLPRREGGRGTEVSTLPGGQNLGEMNDVLYFQKKFLQSLSVPISRLNSDALFSVGRATEITRDEVKFSRFIVRLRHRFSHLFLELLKKQLILKSVTTLEDWELIKNSISFEFAKDNYFAELKDAEIRQSRVSQARDMQDMAGKYVSHEWIRRNVLQQSDDDIGMQDQIIMKEEQSGDPRWVNPMVMQNGQMQQQQEQQQQDQEQGQAQQPQDQGDSGDADDNERVKEIRDAMVFVDQMKRRGSPSNRTTQEQSKFKSSVQLIAKNPEIVQQIGSIRNKD